METHNPHIVYGFIHHGTWFDHLIDTSLSLYSTMYRFCLTENGHLVYDKSAVSLPWLTNNDI